MGARLLRVLIGARACDMGARDFIFLKNGVTKAQCVQIVTYYGTVETVDFTVKNQCQNFAGLVCFA